MWRRWSDVGDLGGRSALGQGATWGRCVEWTHDVDGPGCGKSPVDVNDSWDWLVCSVDIIEGDDGA